MSVNNVDKATAANLTTTATTGAKVNHADLRWTWNRAIAKRAMQKHGLSQSLLGASAPRRQGVVS